MNELETPVIPEEIIMSRIYFIRGRKVMLDMDLAALYGVETKQLKRAVRRNENRFPPDFMFILSQSEFEGLRCRFGTSIRGGVRYPPMAFTEQGVAMLSSVLNSESAILVNIKIMRIFTRMREMLRTYSDLSEKLTQVEQTLSLHDDHIQLIFEYLKQLEQDRQQAEHQADRRRIGYRRGNEE